MVFSVHVAALGYVSEPVISVLGSGIQCDRIHLLWNDNIRIIESMEDVKHSFLNAGYEESNIVFVEINPWDYSDVVNKVMSIFFNEKEIMGNKVQFFTNITLGTSIITAALSTVSYMAGSKMYYKMDSRMMPADTPADQLFKIVPTPKIPDLNKMSPKRRDFLKYISANQPVSIKDVSGFGSKQSLNQFLNYLEKADLLKREREGREVRIVTTELGMMVSQWIL